MASNENELAMGGLIKLDWANLEKDKKLYKICVIISLISIVVMAVMIHISREVAAVFTELPTRTIQAMQEYHKAKEEYRSLFYPSSRSYSGLWQFHGKNSYYFSKGEKSWHDAENFCISRGAHLASILDEEEQNFISSQLQHTTWMGLTTGNKEGSWRWSDGSALVKENWFEEKTSIARGLWKPNQDCVMIEPTLTYRNWKVNSCNKLHRWVCKSLDLGE